MLTIRKGRANRDYENIFFRKFATDLSNLFEDKGIDGLLIGFSQIEVRGFENLQIDALLITKHTIIIIDFKDYGGTLTSNDLENCRWEIDNGVEILAGNANNPYRQLQHQRNRFIALLEKLDFNLNFNLHYTITMVCFQQPITLQVDNLINQILFHIVDIESYLDSIDDLISIVDNRTEITPKDYEYFLNIFRADEFNIKNNFESTSLYFDQQIALSKINSFIKSDERFFYLEGMFGSGKSHITKYINPTDNVKIVDDAHNVPNIFEEERRYILLYDKYKLRSNFEENSNSSYRLCGRAELLPLFGEAKRVTKLLDRGESYPLYFNPSDALNFIGMGSLHGHLNRDIKIVTFSNRLAFRYNSLIRKYLFKRKGSIDLEDIVRFKHGKVGWTFGKVVDIAKVPIIEKVGKVEFRFREITVKTEGGDRIKRLFLENKSILNRDERVAFSKVCNRILEYESGGGKDITDIRSRLLKDENSICYQYRNSINIKFGWVITYSNLATHNKFDELIIDLRRYKNIEDIDYLKRIYFALSRVNRVHLLNAPIKISELLKRDDAEIKRYLIEYIKGRLHVAHSDIVDFCIRYTVRFNMDIFNSIWGNDDIVGGYGDIKSVIKKILEQHNIDIETIQKAYYKKFSSIYSKRNDVRSRQFNFYLNNFAQRGKWHSKILKIIYLTSLRRNFLGKFIPLFENWGVENVQGDDWKIVRRFFQKLLKEYSYKFSGIEIRAWFQDIADRGIELYQEEYIFYRVIAITDERINGVELYREIINGTDDNNQKIDALVECARLILNGGYGEDNINISIALLLKANSINPKYHSTEILYMIMVLFLINGMLGNAKTVFLQYNKENKLIEAKLEDIEPIDININEYELLFQNFIS